MENNSQQSTLQKYFETYLTLCKNDDPSACGDLVQDLDDETCKALYQMLERNEETKDKLVKPLWYNYSTQKFRW